MLSLVQWPGQPGSCAIKSASADGTSEVANVSGREGITWFQHWHEHLPTGGALADTTMNSWACPTKFNFVVAAQPRRQASVGLAGCRFRPRALPHRHHRWHSGAEVLTLHLSDTFTDSPPARDSPALTRPAHLGAVHFVQSVAHFLHRRALRRVCKRRQRRFDERQMHMRHDTLRVELDGRTCLLPCGACPRACIAHSALGTHGSLSVYGAAVAGCFALRREVGWPRILTQGAAERRELPLSQHAVMTSTKRSGNPACRAVLGRCKEHSRPRRREYVCSRGRLLGED